MEPRKTFREWKPQEYAGRAIKPTDVLPEDDLVFFLLDVVRKLDLSAFYASYEPETRGAPPYDVRMMVTLLLYSYCVGVFSSRKIAAACERNLAFLAIVGDQRPDFRTISDFRKRHLEALSELFVDVLQIAGELGLVRLGNLALDGAKVRANASRHKAMSYGYMKKEVERLREEIAELLHRAEEVDAEQDAALGSRRGDELPEELRRRRERLAAIEEAMARLEAEAQEQAAQKRAEREQAEAKRQAEGRKRRGREPKPISEEPAEKAQTNFTDPDAKIMKVSNKGFDYCYNAQAVVDEEEQIIVAADVTNQANDKQQAVPMAEQTVANLEASGISGVAAEPAGEPEAETEASGSGISLSADSGYFSQENVKGLEERGFDPYIAVGREKAAVASSAEPAREPGEGATVKEKMAWKLKTPSGRRRYAKRKHIVEPVFGQTKQGRGFRQFLLRGLENVRREWRLLCLTHNLLKIWRCRYALT